MLSRISISRPMVAISITESPCLTCPDTVYGHSIGYQLSLVYNHVKKYLGWVKKLSVFFACTSEGNDSFRKVRCLYEAQGNDQCC